MHITPELLHNDQKYAYTLKNGALHAHNSSNDGRKTSLLRTGSARCCFRSGHLRNVPGNSCSQQ